MRKITSKMSMIKNYYYLIVGILCILFSFTHVWNGQTTVLPIVNASNIDLATKTTFFYIWHILTAENFVFGVSFLVMAFYKDLSKKVNPCFSNGKLNFTLSEKVKNRNHIML